MRVLLADDHPLFLDGLSNLLAARGVAVVGTARTGLEALEQARALHPDLILMDIRMPQMDGLSALRLIKAELPDVKVVMLSMSAADEELFDAIKAGASGYLLKTQETDEFFVLLQNVYRGESALSSGLASRILAEFTRYATLAPAEGRLPPPNLSARELQVLTLVAHGLRYKEVGAKLFLSERTIKYHMGEIIAKLHVQNRDEAIRYGRQSGAIA
jgi:two-component system NarL family response regulator